MLQGSEKLQCSWSCVQLQNNFTQPSSCSDSLTHICNHIYIYTHTHMHKHIHFTHTWNCPRCAKILKHVEGNGTQQENWTGNCGSTATKKINFMVERAAEWGPKYCRGHEHSVRTDQQHLSRCIKMSALLQFAGIRWHILAYISHHQSIEVSDIQNICPHDACGWPRWLDFFSF